MNLTELIMIVDSREQLAYSFIGLKSERKKLNAGDYSIKGFESRVAVERKTLEDAYGVVGGGRKRFTNCLERLSSLDRAAIVIEASLAEFAIPPVHTQIDAAMAVGSYVSWACQYRIPVFFAGSAAYGERVTLRFLLSYVKHRQGAQE